MRFIFQVVIFMCIAVASAMATTYVAVVETVSSQDVLSRDEKNFVTDRLRERANKVLPAYLGYAVMDRDNINSMLPPGTSIEDCEGSCLVETGRNISANYIAQARVGKVGSKLSLTVVLYDTQSTKHIGDFTTRGKNVDEILDAIDNQADAMFGHILQNGSGIGVVGSDEGFSNVNMGGSGYQASGTKSAIVEVSSYPVGALVSIDGFPNSSCGKTPCRVQLKEGTHRFGFGLDMYFTRDTTFTLSKTNKRLNVHLAPNFGDLEIAPQLVNGVGNATELNIVVDGNRVSTGKMRLAPGSHSVEISHKCYEKAQFTVKIKNGSNLKFDKGLQPLMGGLDLSATEDGKPKSLPVYVNGKNVGETPFLETIPVCSKISVGGEKENIPVILKVGKTVNYTHEYNVIPSVKIGNQIWMKKNLNVETSHSWCYDNKPKNCEKYGRLYTWYDAMNACPAGWHLPSRAEWYALLKYSKYKSEILTSIGFGSLKSGWKKDDGDFDALGDFSFFWSSSDLGDYSAYNVSVGAREFLDYNIGKNNAISVRCLKNSEKITYREVKIGNQTWMGENLKEMTSNSICYRDEFENCEKYGGLYSWHDAKIACPVGWHLPNNEEWNTLFDSVGGIEIAGKNLKSNYGWSHGGERSDSLGFSVFPTGTWHSRYGFDGDGDISCLWSSSGKDNHDGYYFVFSSTSEVVHIGDSYEKGEHNWCSVRCIKNEIIPKHTEIEQEEVSATELHEYVKTQNGDTLNFEQKNGKSAESNKERIVIMFGVLAVALGVILGMYGR